MNHFRYFKCEKCKSLISYPHWNRERERQIKNMKCPQCGSTKLKILRKRPYYCLKHKTYLSLWVKRNGIDVIISK